MCRRGKPEPSPATTALVILVCAAVFQKAHQLKGLQWSFSLSDNLSEMSPAVHKLGEDRSEHDHEVRFMSSQDAQDWEDRN